MTFSVLFLCRTNSARSIMAEALLRQLGKDDFKSHSAGCCPTRIHPLTELVMKENGLHQAQLHAKHVADLEGTQFDFVITLSEAGEHFDLPKPEGRLGEYHWTFPDPELTDGTEAEKLNAFRRTLLELRIRLGLFLSIARRKDFLTASARRSLQSSAA